MVIMAEGSRGHADEEVQRWMEIKVCLSSSRTG
jgi:hypothetical protein